jgi:hypothetical protein
MALAAIYEGASRGEAARMGGVTVQIVRDWVVKLNAHGPAGLIDRKAPGPTTRLTDEHRKILADLIETGPTPAIHGVVRWRLVDLCQWVDAAPGGQGGFDRECSAAASTPDELQGDAAGLRQDARRAIRSGRRDSRRRES